MCFSGYCLEGTVSVAELPEYPATMSVTSVFWSKSSGWDWVLNSASYPYVDGMRTLKSVISIIPSTVSPEVSPGFFLYHSHCNYFQVFFLADDIDILIGFFFFWTTKHFTLIGKPSYRVRPIKEASILMEAETVLDHIPSWNCKETKMSNSFGLRSAFLLRRHKTCKFWKCKSVQI